MRKQLLSVAALSVWTLVHAAGTSAPNDDSIRVHSMNEVVVDASRSGTLLKDLPQKVEIISGSVLKSLPNENVAEVLKRATNLDIIQYPGLSATVGMRGFSPSAHSRSYVLILINGESAGTTNLATIPTDNIEQIEIVKGPYSVLYGSDAMGGVINIITKKDVSKSRGSVSMESGSFGYSKLATSFTGVFGQKWIYGLGYNHQQQSKDYRIGGKNLLDLKPVQKLMLDNASYGDAMDNTQYELNSANAFAGYTINNQWKARAEGNYTYAYDVETAGNYWGTYGQSKKDVNRLNLNLSLEQNSLRNSFRFAPYYTNDKNPNYSDNSDSGYISFTSTVEEYGYQLQDRYQLGSLNLLFGNDLKSYSFLSDRFSAIGTPANPYKPDNQFVNVGVFGQASYTWNQLNLNAGVRYDRFNYHIDANPGLSAPDADADYNTVNPSFGAQYTFLKEFKVHAAYGTAFSVPDAFKVAGKYTVSGKSYIGNADLEPEQSGTAEYGLTYSSDRTGLRMNATYFRTDYDHKIVEQKLESGEYTYINAYKSSMDGLELMTSFNFGQFIRKGLVLEAYANFTWMFNDDFTQLVNDVLLTRDMQYVRKANGNFGLNYSGSQIDMRLNGRYIGTRLEKDNFSTLRTGITSADYYTGGGYTAADKILQHPEYLVFDYSIGYAYSKNVRFGITVSNLLDENYSEKDGYNMPGRSVTAKVSYSF
jgi:vitamin B12 transporter